MKRKGPALRDFVPGYIEAVQRTPIQTTGNLPGGGRLFEACARAAEPAEQLKLGAAFCEVKGCPHRAMSTARRCSGHYQTEEE
jgi:hypothetical protein